jgi:hypothetical protein
MRKGGLVAVVTMLALLGVLVSGCAAPKFTYVTNSTAHTYFKVPTEWRKIDSQDLYKTISGGSGTVPPSVWTVGYDGSTKPAAADALSPRATRPFAYAVVEQINTTTTNELSYNLLRDFFLPVTSAARQNAAQQGFTLKGFKLIRNSMLTPGQGYHGVRETFDYTYPDGSTNTFDQVALTNADQTEVYVLLVHCLATCYQSDAKQIDTVMSSFTVRNS